VREHTASRVSKNYLCFVDISPGCIVRCGSIGCVSCCGHQLESKNKRTKLTNCYINTLFVVLCTYDIRQNRRVLRSRGKGDSTSLWTKRSELLITLLARSVHLCLSQLRLSLLIERLSSPILSVRTLLPDVFPNSTVPTTKWLSTQSMLMLQ